MTTTPTPHVKPWLKRKPRPRPSEVVIIGNQEPQAEIRVYSRYILLTRRDRIGQWRSHLVSAAALAHTFAKTPASSGLLTPNMLAAGRVAAQQFFVAFVPPRMINLQTDTQTYRIPTPPLVIGGCGTDYRIFALASPTFPDRGDVPLFVAPFPNCYVNGGICWGNVAPRPPAQAATLLATLLLFLEGSLFNLHVAGEKSVRYPVSVLAHYAVLAERHAKRYPTNDLIPADYRLEWLVAGQPWGAR